MLCVISKDSIKASVRINERGIFMDYNKPIYAEIVEDQQEIEKFRAYLNDHGINFKESTEMSIDGVHIFEMMLTKEQLFEVNAATDALFYQ